MVKKALKALINSDVVMHKINIHFSIQEYHKLLLSWFDLNGRHNLPWQGKFNPYHVWVSEIMLQQTQVKTVIPYFLKFIDAFPNVSSIASVEQDKVMWHWAGLGYYARARNLYKAAQLVHQIYGGYIPNKVDQLLNLPGIGKSTAHAILSIAFNKALPIMDSNVKRLFIRIFYLDKFISNSTQVKIMWWLAYQLMPSERTQPYTQAQMDLGSIICTRRKPKCDICPLKSVCLSFRNSETIEIEKRLNNRDKTLRKTVKPSKLATFYLYIYEGSILLIKRPNQGIWGGLYALSEAILNGSKYAFTLCKNQKHIFTHYTLYYSIEVYHLGHRMNIDNGHWILKADIEKYALPAPLLKHLLNMDSVTVKCLK